MVITDLIKWYRAKGWRERADKLSERMGILVQDVTKQAKPLTLPNESQQNKRKQTHENKNSDNNRDNTTINKRG